MTGFYDTYASYTGYRTPELGPKQARRRLLAELRPKRAAGGKVVVEVPNAACPWGLLTPLPFWSATPFAVLAPK